MAKRPTKPIADCPRGQVALAARDAKRRGTKAEKKAPVGRPTKFRPEFCEQAQRLALLGQSDARMAEFFGVGESTLNRWKHEFPQFRECLIEGRDQADSGVAESLYRTALGGGKVTEVREEPDGEGGIIRKRVIRELPPDVRAQKYWLACRRPDKWRESLRVEDVTPPEALAETAQRFEEIMSQARARQRRILIDRGILPPDEGKL